MQTSRPPTIPASANSDSSYARTMKVQTLQVDSQVTGTMDVPTLTVEDQVAFFGAALATQQTVTYPTINEIIKLMQTYGLAAPGFTQESQLLGTDAVGNSQQGMSTALSADGNTLAIGGPRDDSYIGAAWVFVKTGGVWAQQGSKLVGTGATGTSTQGYVSLSADGNTLAVGGYNDDSGKGAVWIYTRTDGVWTQQGSKLVGTGAVGNAYRGVSVCLSPAGDTLAVGGTGDSTNVGATWIFVRTGGFGGTWAQQGSKLVGTDVAAPHSFQGCCVSLDGEEDTLTLAVGGSDDNNYAGAVWIFTRSGTTWTQQGSKLISTGAESLGYSVSLKGNTLVAGAPSTNSELGCNIVFNRSGTTWTQTGSQLVGTGDAGGEPFQGSSVALATNEEIFISSGPYDGIDNDTGAVWVFKLVDGVWTQYNQKLVPTGYIGGATIGGDSSTTVSINSDGRTISMGGAYNDANVGATWVYVE